MERLLILDTCGSSGYVTVVDAAAPATPLAHRSIAGRETQERLLTAMAEALAAVPCTPAQLAGIAVVTGPGSFTGVRIGLAAAKGLAEACGVRMLPLSRLAVLAEAARPHAAPETRITTWLDAGRTDLYAGTYVLGQAGAMRTVAEAMLPRAAALASVGDMLVLEDAQLAALWPGAQCLDPEAMQQATRLLAAGAFHAGSFADAALLDANYLRVPDAELALRARQMQTA